MSQQEAKQRAEFVKELEARFTSRAGFPITLERLVSRWCDFVTDVERGYDDSIDEYTNDVTTRDLLEEALQSAPDAIRRSLYDKVLPCDDRFRGATRPDDAETLGRYMKLRPHWWWKRIPLKVSPSLAAALLRG